LQNFIVVAACWAIAASSMLGRGSSSLNASRVVVAVAAIAASSFAWSPARADAPLLKPPVVRVSAEPTPPDDAEARAMEATVRLELDIDATGKVTDARVVEGPGHGFDEAAIAAARKLEFDPATRDGKPIASKLRWRFHFDKRVAPPPPEPPPVADTPIAPVAPPPPAHGELHVVVHIADVDAPIAGARVEVTGPDGAKASKVTDASGAVAFADLVAGTYHVTIAAPGFDGASSDEGVFAGQSTDVVDRLAATASSDEIVIKGERKPREVTVRVLEQRELSRIPGTNGDALKAVQTMPGVARAPGLGSALIVRGSAPADTQVFIDGIPIPIVYHFGGLSSVVPTEMLDRLEFRPGNFGAEYGRAMGGVIDVRTQSAPTDGAFHGLAQADFIDTRFVAKGKIPLLDGWSFVAGARRSYVDVWLGPILSRRNGGFTSAPVYYDWQLFAETRPTPKSRFRIGFFGSDDSLLIYRDTVNTRDPADVGDLGLHTGFGRVTAMYENEFSRAARLFAVVAYGWDVQSFTSGSVGTTVTGHPIVGRSELSITLRKGYVLHVGLDTLYSQTNVNIARPPPSVPGQPDPGTSGVILQEQDAPSFFLPAMYTEMEMQLSHRLRAVPSFRVDYDGATKQWNTAPRISARYGLTRGEEPLTLKGGAGVYYQPPQPQEISPVFGTPGLRSNRSYHLSLGLEQSLDRRVEISVEGFYKILDDLVVRSASPSGGTIETNLGTGNVVGAEVLIRLKPDDRLFGWIAYTLSRATRVDGPGLPEHLFRFDQTHILTALASYRVGHGWEIGARFRVVSGNPYTPCLGGALDAATTSYSCIAGPSFSDRLPIFHQLDLRLDKHWYFDGYQISAYLDVYNAYDRGNAEGIAYNFDYSQHIYQTGLPIVPSLGIRGEL
jgi:TonB family protein